MSLDVVIRHTNAPSQPNRRADVLRRAGVRASAFFLSGNHKWMGHTCRAQALDELAPRAGFGNIRRGGFARFSERRSWRGPIARCLLSLRESHSLRLPRYLRMFAPSLAVPGALEALRWVEKLYAQAQRVAITSRVVAQFGTATRARDVRAGTRAPRAAGLCRVGC